MNTVHVCKWHNDQQKHIPYKMWCIKIRLGRINKLPRTLKFPHQDIVFVVLSLRADLDSIIAIPSVTDEREPPPVEKSALVCPDL